MCPTGSLPAMSPDVAGSGVTPRLSRQSRAASSHGGNVGAMPPRTATTDPTSLAVSQPELTSSADTAPELPELMTSAEVAAALRISPYQVREYVRTAVLPAYRVGRELRIPRADVVRYLHGLRITR